MANVASNAINVVSKFFVETMHKQRQGAFEEWREQRLVELNAGAQMVETACGPMEYTRLGEGPVILASHGTPGGYDQGLLLADLGADGFSILSPSRPGYLRTPLETGRTLEAQADALAALLDTLGIDKAAVVGASGGGAVGLQMALRHPDRVWALLMTAAVSQEYEAVHTHLGELFLNKDETELSEFAMWLLHNFSRKFPSLFAQTVISTESHLSREQVKATVNSMMQNPRQVAWYEGLLDSITPYNVRKQGLENDLLQLIDLPVYPLEQISAPTIVVHGTADADIPYDHGKFVAERVPGATFITLEDCGHLMWLDERWPDIEARLVEFLREHAPDE